MHFLFAMFLTATPGPTGGEAGEPGLGSILMTFLPFVLIAAALYFVMIRPESKRKKEAAKMRDELIVGDEITTIGGIVGKIVSIKDDTVTVETGSERNRIQIMRWAISSKGAKETSE